MKPSYIYKMILKNPYGSVFVTDKDGTVIFVNAAAEKLLGRSLKNLVGLNVKKLLDEGFYDRSTILECISTKSVFIGTLKAQSGRNIMAVSSPILDENGDIVATVTNSLDTTIVEEYLQTLEYEKKKAKKYKEAITYLVGMNNTSKELIAESSTIKKVLNEAYKAAQVDCSILVLGESGVGKEVFVNYIHQHGARSGEALIPINCAAIPKDLLESELFGYEKGAFTGANEKGKAGLFELASRGTVFLDEIAEMPLVLQAKLLRVIETKKVQRLGSTISKDVDFRLIAATNKDLYKMVKEGTFRDDLYYRLNVVPIHIPPLRERPEDILALISFFLEKFDKKYNSNRVLSEQEKQAFIKYSWPGNIRELQNVIERIVITNADAESVLNITESGTSDNKNYGLKEYMNDVEWRYIQQVLKECDGKVSEAAKRLDIHRTLLYKKIEFFKNKK